MADDLPLKDIHLPEAITWWPLAIGWWVVIILAILLMIGGYLTYKRVTRKTARKQAKSILQSIKKNASADALQTIKDLSACLRRVAISVDSREQVAGLIGESWLSYLDQSMEGTPFKTGIGRVLVEAPYQPLLADKVDIKALINLCENWLERQQR